MAVFNIIVFFSKGCECTDIWIQVFILHIKLALLIWLMGLVIQNWSVKELFIFSDEIFIQHTFVKLLSRFRPVSFSDWIFHLLMDNYKAPIRFEYKDNSKYSWWHFFKKYMLNVLKYWLPTGKAKFAIRCLSRIIFLVQPFCAVYVYKLGVRSNNLVWYNLWLVKLSTHFC